MLSGTLQLAVANARIALSAHPSGDLQLGYRRAVFAAMGPHQESAVVLENRGWVRRVQLSLLATSRVLPLWELAFPNERLPHIILAEAASVGAGNAGVAQGGDTYGRYQAQIETFENTKGEGFRESVVAWCALRSLSAALWDEVFEADGSDINLTDYTYDVELADASCYACYIEANGWLMDPESDPNKRRAFWEWWLDEAVPRAYEYAPD